MKRYRPLAKAPQVFYASCLQIRIAYQALNNEEMPNDISYQSASERIINRHGLKLFERVVEAIPNDINLTDNQLINLAKKALG